MQKYTVGSYLLTIYNVDVYVIRILNYLASAFEDYLSHVLLWHEFSCDRPKIITS